MKKISIIVPVYNVEKYLERCVNSLINQTYKNLEIILVDDGSKDSSGVLCNKLAYENKVIKVIHKENGGLSSARNAGLEIATGEYIGFVDSDDWVSIDMYEYLLSIIEQYDCDVAQVEYSFTYDDSAIVKQRNYSVKCVEGRNEILITYLQEGMKEIKSYPVCTKLYKAKCFDTIRFPVGQLYEDVVTNYDILSNANRYVLSSKRCYFYFINPNSITRSKFTNKDLDYVMVGKQIVERTKMDLDLKHLGIMTLARFHFMCLCKMIKYTCSGDVDIDRQVNESIDAIREGYSMLLKSKMKNNRKLILILLCINKHLTRFIAKINS